MRVTTTKSKNAESFYINYAYVDKNGKSTSRIYKKLGTLKELSERLNTDRDGVMAWARKQAKEETEKYKAENEKIYLALSPNALIEKERTNTFNCGYLFLQSICSSLRIDNICRNIKTRYNYEYDLHAILTDLIYARILSPSSKLSSYEYCNTLLEKPKYELHDVYRALYLLAKESDYIQSELYRNSEFLHKRNTKVLYYDCTNYFFEIEEAKEDKQYGKGKEHRPNPIVGMGLFMDSDGIPLAFDIYPGNKNEQLTLKPLEEKVIRDFDCSKFIYCSDSGLGSKKNKLLNSVGDKAYVITQSLKKLKKEDRDIALNTKQYRLLNGDNKFIDLNDLDETDPKVFNSIYYKEIPLDNGKLQETLIVTYSPKYKEYQRRIRQGQIDRAKEQLNNGKVKKNRRNPNDPARFFKRIDTTENGEVAKETYYLLDEDVIKNEEQYDGFYGTVTNLEADVKDIIAINKRRWQIEECFRIMKTEFKARPVYLSRQDAIKSHFLTCFIALLVYRLLEDKLENKYTVNQIVDTLRDMNLLDVEGLGYMPAFKRSDVTDSLHDLVTYRLDNQIIKKAKMKSIIHESKIKDTLR